MIGDEQMRMLAQEGHPVLLVGSGRRQLLTLARKLHGDSEYAGGPFLIHRCGTSVLPESIHVDLVGLCAGLFSKAAGGTVYFERVDGLSPEESKQLYMVLERGEYWDPEHEELVPVRFRILASAPSDVLDPACATKLTYRLAERIIRLAPGSSE